MGLAGRLTRMATTRTPVHRAARNAVLSLVDALPPARHRIALSLSGLARRGATDLAA